jgi:trimeric autotransporter adhesin
VSLTSSRLAASWSALVVVVSLCAVIFVASGAPANAQPVSITLQGPTGSKSFGDTVKVLANGNYVVTDPNFATATAVDVGAVHLYNGKTNELISTLTGSSDGDKVGIFGVVELANSNFAVPSPYWNNAGIHSAGAVTWVNGTTGLSGVVSTSNSLHGTSNYDQVGWVTALTNGNYVVSSYSWSNGALQEVGAVTWVNGTTGLSGEVSTSNSLYGPSRFDQIGRLGVTALANGNYVVTSPYWDGELRQDVGAVTWVNGTTGATGVVSSSNSLYGTSLFDHVGYGQVTALANGNYVVSSPDWSNGAASRAGAVTLANGSAGLIGPVSTANSLYGSSVDDQVGSHALTELTGGSHVVPSPFWNNGAAARAGAVTLVNGNTGLVGAVSTTNSLYGSSSEDFVGLGGVKRLTDGSYVVSSYFWDDGSTPDVGAVTWASGATGLRGAVSNANSLHGATAKDRVGGVTALTNGSYVVASPSWDRGSTPDVGAVTWVNGGAAMSGTVSASNSLYGTTAYDFVGSDGVTALTNGNYVVASSSWDSDTTVNSGAVTFGSGAGGIVGAVSASNSLFGSTRDDLVGDRGVRALPNGRYLAISDSWTNGIYQDVGAITLSEAGGIVGPVSSLNSVVASSFQNLSYSADGITSGGAVAVRGWNRVVLVNVTPSPTPPSVSHDLTPLVPGRLVDTRASGVTVDGVLAASGKRGAGSVLEVPVTGRGGVPSDASSAVLNVTAVGPDAGGFLTVYPCGVPQPNASNVNYKPGQDIANAVVTAIGAGGKVCVATSAQTDLIVDVNGALPVETTLSTRTPARIHDTRPAGATVDGIEQHSGRVAAGSVTTVRVGGRAGVPSDALGAIVNVTADATDASGFVTVFPCDRPQPNASNLNYPNGGTVAGLSIAKLGADGTVCFYTSAAMQLIVDVTGFVPSMTTYQGRDPGRFLDTRPSGATVDGQSVGAGVRPADTTTEFVIPGRAGLSASTKTAVLNVTSTGSQGAGFLTVYPCGQPRPNASNVNYQAGIDIANTVITSVGTGGKVCVYTSSPTHIIADLNGTLNA